MTDYISAAVEFMAGLTLSLLSVAYLERWPALAVFAFLGSIGAYCAAFVMATDRP